MMAFGAMSRKHVAAMYCPRARQPWLGSVEVPGKKTLQGRSCLGCHSSRAHARGDPMRYMPSAACCGPARTHAAQPSAPPPAAQVAEDNADARRLYARCGFTMERRTAHDALQLLRRPVLRAFLGSRPGCACAGRSPPPLMRRRPGTPRRGPQGQRPLALPGMGPARRRPRT